MIPYKVQYVGQDDQRLTALRRDFSGGMNTRQHPSKIGENQAKEITNIDISTIGELNKRPGSVQIGATIGTDPIIQLHDYGRQNYTDQLIAVEDTSIWASESEGNFAELKDDLTASTDIGIVNIKMSGVTPDDVMIFQNNQDNPFMIRKASDGNWTLTDLGSTAGTGSDSPPKSTVMGWYGNRLWVQKNDLLYWADAYASDYSTAFDTVTNSFRVPVGKEMFMAPTRDLGIIVGGQQAIWAIAPSVTPVATDKPQPIITDKGCVSKDAWALIGDDIYFFSQDGLRALKRTVQDKVQMGADYAISYLLKDEFEGLNWAYIDRLNMKYFDNKLFISCPTSSTTFKTWIYYPALNAFSVVDDWKPRCMTIHKISGEDRLYYGSFTTGKVFRGWFGYTDEGTTITNGDGFTSTFIGREEDFQQPFVYKNGGELEVEALVAGGNYEIDVYISKDGQSFNKLGILDLSSATAPVLPIDLPFSLADTYIVREKFHLESLGRWKTIQVKIENEDKNTESIKSYGYSIVTFPEEYENE
jgi:hypothetical protein